MKKVFKISRLNFSEQTISEAGFFGNDRIPTLDGNRNSELDEDFESEAAAESAIELFGNGSNYVIQSVYKS